MPSTSGPTRCRRRIFEQLESRRLLTSPPVFSDQTLHIDENSPAESEVGVMAVQHDGPIEFQITGGSGQHLFKVEPQTGRLLVQAPANLDHESADLYQLNVIARDPTDLDSEDTAVVTIRIDDVPESPVVVNTLGTEPVLGSVPFEVWIPETTFADPDLNDTFSLSISLVGGAPAPSWLNFDPLTGDLSGLAPNSAREIQILVTATDSTARTGVETLILEVIENPYPWQNFIDELDINNDSQVTPQDMALLAQDLFRNSVHDLPFSGPNDPPVYLDVFADNRVTPQDVAVLSAHLVRQAQGQAEAEGESSAAADEAAALAETAWQNLMVLDPRGSGITWQPFEKRIRD